MQFHDSIVSALLLLGKGRQSIPAYVHTLVMYPETADVANISSAWSCDFQSTRGESNSTHLIKAHTIVIVYYIQVHTSLKGYYYTFWTNSILKAPT